MKEIIFEQIRLRFAVGLVLAAALSFYLLQTVAQLVMAPLSRHFSQSVSPLISQICTAEEGVVNPRPALFIGCGIYE